MKLNSTNLKYLPEENFFFADSFQNITGEFNNENNNNSLVLNFEDNLTMIHTNLFQVDISGQKLSVFYDVGCRQIYFRVPGEHEINGKKFDMEMQFNCSATINDIIHGVSTDNTFNFFVSYPLNISQSEGKQSEFFDDIFNKGNLKLNEPLIIRSAKEIMNNYNMFDKIYFYRGMIYYIIDSLIFNLF